MSLPSTSLDSSRKQIRITELLFSSSQSVLPDELSMNWDSLIMDTSIQNIPEFNKILAFFR